MTHAELVEIASRWLRGTARCSLVATELVTGLPETPDAIGWNGTFSTLIEVKVSVSDFMFDKNKSVRKYPETGIGSNKFYVVPREIADQVKTKMPDKWGLLVVTGSRVREEIRSEYFETNLRREVGFMLSIIKRIAGNANPLKGVYVRCYTIESQGEPNATLWVEPEKIIAEEQKQPTLEGLL